MRICIMTVSPVHYHVHFGILDFLGFASRQFLDYLLVRWVFFFGWRRRELFLLSPWLMFWCCFLSLLAKDAGEFQEYNSVIFTSGISFTFAGFILSILYLRFSNSYDTIYHPLLVFGDWGRDFIRPKLKQDFVTLETPLCLMLWKGSILTWNERKWHIIIEARGICLILWKQCF